MAEQLLNCPYAVAVLKQVRAGCESRGSLRIGKCAWEFAGYRDLARTKRDRASRRFDGRRGQAPGLGFLVVAACSHCYTATGGKARRHPLRLALAGPI